MSNSFMSKSLMTALISVSLVLSPMAHAGFFKKALIIGGAVVVGKAIAGKHREHVQRMQNQQNQPMQPVKPNKQPAPAPAAPANNEQVQQFLEAYR